MGLSQHAYERIFTRLTPKEQQELFRRLKVIEELRHKYCGHDFALRLLKLGAQRNEAWSEQSNGDEVWAILRRGEIKTVMLRRSTQPPTAAALRVDKVVFL